MNRMLTLSKINRNLLLKRIHMYFKSKFIFILIFLLLNVSFIIPNNLFAEVGDQHTINSTGSSINKILPDVVYNPYCEKYLATWISDDSHNMYGMLLDKNFNRLTSEFIINSSSGWIYGAPKVAYSNQNEFLVLYSSWSGVPNTSISLRVKKVTSTGSVGSAETIEYFNIGTLANTLRGYDIGGCGFRNEYLIVWGESWDFVSDQEVNVVRYSPLTGIIAEFSISESSGVKNPSVSQCGYNYYVGYERHYSNLRVDIEGCWIPSDADSKSDTESEIKIVEDSGVNLVPDVAVDDSYGQGVYVWHQKYDDNDYDIIYAKVNPIGQVYIGTVDNSSQIEFNPSVSKAGGSNYKFLITYAKSTNDWNGDWNIVSKYFDIDDYELSSLETISNESINEGSPSVTMGSEDNGHVVVIWDREDSNLMYCREMYYQLPLPSPPDPPSNCSASDGAYTDKVRVTWTDNSSNETNFYIYRATSSGGSYSHIGTANANATSYDDTRSCGGTDYYYKVSAYNSSGESSFSNYDKGDTATCTGTTTISLVPIYNLLLNSTSISTDNCGAYVAPGVWKEFDCYNLAAIGKTTNDDPFTPSWRLIGGYWQWGRKGPSSSQWYNTNTSNFVHGPTGPDSSEANGYAISGWEQTYAPDGYWSDASKTANDPCPVGFRVPTRTQWSGVNNNNTQNTVGSSWITNATNYSSARFFGNDLMLPTAGGRFHSNGWLLNRGYYGEYWSSTEDSGDIAWYLWSCSSHAATFPYNRRYGFSVRCVAE